MPSILISEKGFITRVFTHGNRILLHTFYISREMWRNAARCGVYREAVRFSQRLLLGTRSRACLNICLRISRC